MARRGRLTVEIKLSGNERKALERWARRHSSAQSLEGHQEALGRE